MLQTLSRDFLEFLSNPTWCYQLSSRLLARKIEEPERSEHIANFFFTIAKNGHTHTADLSFKKEEYYQNYLIKPRFLTNLNNKQFLVLLISLAVSWKSIFYLKRTRWFWSAESMANNPGKDTGVDALMVGLNIVWQWWLLPLNRYQKVGCVRWCYGQRGSFGVLCDQE